LFIELGAKFDFSKFNKKTQLTLLGVCIKLRINRSV